MIVLELYSYDGKAQRCLDIAKFDFNLANKVFYYKQSLDSEWECIPYVLHDIDYTGSAVVIEVRMEKKEKEDD